MDGLIPEGATIFIGDSITQGLATSAVSNQSVNYGIGSDTTLGVLKRLPYYNSMNSAKAVRRARSPGTLYTHRDGGDDRCAAAGGLVERAR